MTRPTVVVLCEHGETKPHSYPSREDADDTNPWLTFDGSVFGLGRVTRWCPGGRVLNQAIIIERDENGEWPKWVEECGAYVRWENKSSSWAVRTVGEVLDFLVIAQEALASTQEQP